ncbi:MAG: hypothetical protein ACUVTE_01040 [Candidatus Bathycorpusculaceae bacterium]
MIRVNVSITNVSGERFWDIRKPIPPIQINTNLNLVEVEKKTDEVLEVPFVLTVNYNPSVAQISLKGRAYVTGSKDEIVKIYSEYKEKKPPPPVLVQSISNVVFVESVIISRTLNIPPPIPLPQIPQTKEDTGKKTSGTEYTA